MKPIFLLVPLMGLAACVTPEPGAQPSGDTCGAARYAYLKGEPDTTVEATSFNQPVRITRSRDHVTSDHVPERLNFLLDGSGNVAAISCG